MTTGTLVRFTTQFPPLHWCKPNLFLIREIVPADGEQEPFALLQCADGERIPKGTLGIGWLDELEVVEGQLSLWN
jgi:hypothetical protein